MAAIHITGSGALHEPIWTCSRHAFEILPKKQQDLVCVCKNEIWASPVYRCKARGGVEFGGKLNTLSPRSLRLTGCLNFTQCIFAGASTPCSYWGSVIELAGGWLLRLSVCSWYCVLRKRPFRASIPVTTFQIPYLKSATHKSVATLTNSKGCKIFMNAGSPFRSAAPLALVFLAICLRAWNKDRPCAYPRQQQHDVYPTLPDPRCILAHCILVLFRTGKVLPTLERHSIWAVQIQRWLQLYVHYKQLGLRRSPRASCLHRKARDIRSGALLYSGRPPGLLDERSQLRWGQKRPNVTMPESVPWCCAGMWGVEGTLLLWRVREDQRNVPISAKPYSRVGKVLGAGRFSASLPCRWE